MNAPRSSKPTTVLLLLLVALAVGACSGSADDHLPTAVTAQSPATSDPKLVARGEYLAKAGDCSACHDAADHTPLGGGLPVNSPFGPIYASNITPDPTFGIGRYSLKEFSDALRYGKRRDGERLYPAMPYASFAKMNDADVTALYAYLMHGVTPAAKRAPRTHLPFPFNQRWGMLFWTFAFGNRDEFSPDPKQSAQWNRGAYLVQGLGHCGACHTPRGPAYNELGYSEASPLYLTGGVVDHWLAPNLTGDRGSGLGRWSRQDIVNFLRTGHGAGTIAFGAMAPAVEDSTQYLTDLDLNAIGEYLKSLPRSKRTVPTTTTRVPSYKLRAALRLEKTNGLAQVYTCRSAPVAISPTGAANQAKWRPWPAPLSFWLKIRPQSCASSLKAVKALPPKPAPQRRKCLPSITS